MDQTTNTINDDEDEGLFLGRGLSSASSAIFFNYTGCNVARLYYLSSAPTEAENQHFIISTATFVRSERAPTSFGNLDNGHFIR